jgi:peptide/nickel transport system permease protein
MMAEDVTLTRERARTCREPKGITQRFLKSGFWRAVRNNPFAAPGLLIVVGFLVIAVFPGLFAQADPTKINMGDRMLPPSAEHPAGTDWMGMDQYSRIIYGARVTLQNVAIVLAIATSAGFLVGSTAGFLGGYVDEVLMRVTDVFLAFPSLILAIAVNSVLGRGLFQTMLAVGFSWWPSYARLIRGQVLCVKNEEYVMAAEALGAKPSRVLLKHVLPNCFATVIVRITLDVGFVALTTAGLSFLGLGVEPPTPEWGRMVAEGRDYLLQQWWMATFPGLALFLVVVGFNLFGEIVRDWLDPSGINR